MKKVSIVALGAILLVGAAHAEFQETVTTVTTGKGGFSGGTDTIVTTEQITELRDDTPVVMTGKIVKRTGGEKYLFQDGAGTVIIEIDDDDWRGANVTPNDTIKVYGEIDRGVFNTEVDVDYVELINQ